MKPKLHAITTFLLVAALAASIATAAAKNDSDVSTPGDYILLTIVLKHDQSKTLEQLRSQLESSGFWAEFPPHGIAVESWYVMMGLGQVVTLRVPPSRLREVNRAVEQHAWGAFRTEIYATYDLSGAAREFRARARKGR